MRTISSEHQTDTISGWHPSPGRAKCWSCQAPNVSAPSYGRRGEGLLISQHVNIRNWRIFPKRSNWSLEGKENNTFHLDRKRNSFRLVVSSLIQKSENAFSPQENRGPLSYLFKKTKVYRVNQTVAFQSRVLFLASGFHEKNCRKMCLVRAHSICRRLVGREILLHVHPPQSRRK